MGMIMDGTWYNSDAPIASKEDLPMLQGRMSLQSIL